MASYPRARMSAALTHLSSVLTTIPSASAVVIFLQEIQESENGMPNSEQEANDFTQLRNADWVRELFHMTDVDAGNWDGASYGTVTLVDRRLSIEQVARLPFVSEFQRDALFVDVRLSGGEETESILRLCNVHLDSMSGEMRPIQWKGLADLLQPYPDDGTNDRIAASIVAGDCNANQPRDRTEPQDNGFRDAYLELGGVEDDEEGATWGFQSIKSRFGPKRLDKVVFWGNLHVSSLERVGIDVKVEEERVVRELEELGELPFATDHFGLMGVFTVEGGLATRDVVQEPVQAYPDE